METSHCVPSWDVDGHPSRPSSSLLPLHHYSGEPRYPPLNSRKDYEVAELTWENGQLLLHGLVPPRIGKAIPKNPPPSGVAHPEDWNKQHHRRSGTLEAVVDQATGGGPDVEMEEWFGGGGVRGGRSAADALVPCQDDATNARRPKRPRMAGVCSSQGSASGARVESTTLVTLGTWREDEGDDDVALTATATTATNSASPETESMSLGERKGLAVDDHVSVSHTRSHTKLDSLYDDEENPSKVEAEKASTSTKKRRAAAVHNQSERKRRDRINQRMKTLQKLVPNSSKTDKASMLDEVIEYLKQLQAQIQMMGRMSNMMMPMAAAVMPGQIPVPPMMAAHFAHMAQLQHQQLPHQMGMGRMDLASIGRTTTMPGPSLPMLHPSAAFLALPALTAGAWDGSAADRRVGSAVLADPYSALLACQMAQQQPMSLDEYSRMATLFEQLCQQQQQPPSNGK